MKTVFSFKRQIGFFAVIFLFNGTIAAADTGLIAYWPFDTAVEGAVYIDKSDHGYNVVSNCDLAVGVKQNALNCTNSFLAPVKNSKTAFDLDSLTIEAWINFSSSNNYMVIFSHQTYESGDGGFETGIGSDGTLQLNMAYFGSNGWVQCVSNSVLLPGRWYHVASTYDGKTMKVYINGSLSGQLSNTSGYAHTQTPDACIGVSGVLERNRTQLVQRKNR
jgi:large repetitive protein